MIACNILKYVVFSAHKTQSGTSSDDELSYFLLTDNLDQLKKSHSSSMPKIFKGSLKDYQGLEGVSVSHSFLFSKRKVFRAFLLEQR